MLAPLEGRSNAGSSPSVANAATWHQRTASAARTCVYAIYRAGSRRSLLRRATHSTADGAAARLAIEGDTVLVHFTVFDEDNERLESSKDVGQPLTFEVGSSEVIGNDLLRAFDGGVRGLHVGETRRVELEPLQKDWSRDLLFKVPKDHPEVTRLEGKFGGSGGLREGMIVELANGAQAHILKITEDDVVLDANDATAGRKVSFELELVKIQS